MNATDRVADPGDHAGAIAVGLAWTAWGYAIGLQSAPAAGGAGGF